MNEFPIRRNTALLAAAMAVQSATLQLVVAASAITFVLVTGHSRLLGLGPALFLFASAVTSLPAGRLMDRVGRVPVIAGGFFLGALGALLAGLGAYHVSGAIAIPGFLLVGAAAATGQLARTAAGDMYPPAQRARGIAFVMFGAVFGAILGPTVFSPMFRDRELVARALAMPWFAGAGMMLIAMAIVLFIRPDPKKIAEALEEKDREDNKQIPRSARGRDDSRETPLREILRRPGVATAMLAGIASHAVMVSVMNLTGYVVVGHRHHPQHLVFPIIGAHVLGMYLLMPVVGVIVDRVGRARALAAGLMLIAFATGGLAFAERLVPIGVSLFALGLGWNVSFVAATTQLADLAAPWERGRLLGFNDLVAGLTTVVFVLLGGTVLDSYGVTALAFGASVLALLPVAFILVGGRRAELAREASS